MMRAYVGFGANLGDREAMVRSALEQLAAEPGVEVVGVQSEAAPAAFRSWQARRLVEDRMGTAAEGLATRTASRPFGTQLRSEWSTSPGS